MVGKERIEKGRWYLEDDVPYRDREMEEGSWIHYGLGSSRNWMASNRKPVIWPRYTKES